MYIDAGTILNGQTEWDDIFLGNPWVSGVGVGGNRLNKLQLGYILYMKYIILLQKCEG